MNGPILIPFDLTDPEPLQPELVDNLTAVEVVALGYYPLPEQTPADTGREEFGDAARETLDKLIDPLVEAGVTVITRLVFGKDRAGAINQVMDEEDCIAELGPAVTTAIDRVLVPMPHIEDLTRLPDLVALISQDTPQEITLFHVVEEGMEREAGDDIVAEARERMSEAGMAIDRIKTRVTEGGNHDDEILRVAPEYDAVIMYEPQPRLSDAFFGSLAQRVQSEVDGPVIVVRRDY